MPPAYPEGLYDLLLKIHARYENFGLKNILITENGTPEEIKFNKDNKIDDAFRIEYVKKHLAMVNKVI